MSLALVRHDYLSGSFFLRRDGTKKYSTVKTACKICIPYLHKSTSRSRLAQCHMIHSHFSVSCEAFAIAQVKQKSIRRTAFACGTRKAQLWTAQVAPEGTASDRYITAAPDFSRRRTHAPRAHCARRKMCAHPQHPPRHASRVFASLWELLRGPPERRRCISFECPNLRGSGGPLSAAAASASSATPARRGGSRRGLARSQQTCAAAGSQTPEHP